MDSKKVEEPTFEKRRAEFERIRAKFPNRIPVIVTVNEGSDLPPLDKSKFLVPADLTMGQFSFVIRRRISLEPEKAMFLFVNNGILSTSSLMSQVYEQNKGDDGFLRISISGENCFGG